MLVSFEPDLSSTHSDASGWQNKGPVLDAANWHHGTIHPINPRESLLPGNSLNALLLYIRSGRLDGLGCQLHKARADTPRSTSMAGNVRNSTNVELQNSNGAAPYAQNARTKQVVCSACRQSKVY